MEKLLKQMQLKEKKYLKVLDSDEGARRLGEVALVPDNSPISQTGLLFYNTLLMKMQHVILLLDNVIQNVLKIRV